MCSRVVFYVCLLFFVLCRGWRVVVGVESCSGGHCDVVGVVLRALAYEMGKCGNSLYCCSSSMILDFLEFD